MVMSSAAWATPSSSTEVPRPESPHRRYGAAAASPRATMSSPATVTPEKVSVVEVEPSTFGIVAMPRPAALRGTRHNTVSRPAVASTRKLIGRRAERHKGHRA